MAVDDTYSVLVPPAHTTDISLSNPRTPCVTLALYSTTVLCDQHMLHAQSKHTYALMPSYQVAGEQPNVRGHMQKGAHLYIHTSIPTHIHTAVQRPAGLRSAAQW